MCVCVMWRGEPPALGELRTGYLWLPHSQPFLSASPQQEEPLTGPSFLTELRVESLTKCSSCPSPKAAHGSPWRLKSRTII